MSKLDICVALRVSTNKEFDSLEEFTAYVTDECSFPEEIGDGYLCGECEGEGFFIDCVINGAIPPDGLVEVGAEEAEAIEDKFEKDFSKDLLDSVYSAAFVVYFK